MILKDLGGGVADARVEYVPIDGLRVGPVVLELSDRATFRRDERGTPRSQKRTVLTLAVEGDMESAAQARTLAAAIEAFAAKLS